MTHILNRQAPPVAPKPEPEKLTPEQAKIKQQLKRTKAGEAVVRAIERGRRA